MKKIIKNIKLIIVSLVLITTLLIPNKLFASSSSSLSVSASGTTVTIKGNDLTGRVNISVSNGTSSSQSVWLENNSQTVTITLADPTKASTVTVSPTAGMSDSAGEDVTGVTSKSVTIAATKKEDPKPEPKPDQDPDKNNGNTGNTPQNTTVEPTQKSPEFDKSGEYHLNKLSTSVGTLKPNFSAYNQDYTLEFPEDYDMSELTSINVSASAMDSKAKVSGTGEFDVKEGENEIVVNCTAENGKVLAYRIKFAKVIKANQSDLRLKTFSITKLREEDKKEILAKLNEEFKPDVFEYTMNVDETTKELNITYEIEEKFKDKIDVEITGNTDLKPGDNTILIKLTSKEDDKITTTYMIKVTKAGAVEEKAVEETKTSGGLNIKLIIIIGASVIGALVLTLIVLLIVNHIQKKKVKTTSAKVNSTDEDDKLFNGDNGFDADIGHETESIGIVGPTTEDSSESNYDYLSRDEEFLDDQDEDDEKRFGGAGYNTLHQEYNPDEDYNGFDDTDLPEGTVSEHMLNARLNGEADELKKRYEVDEMQEEIADGLKDKKTKRRGSGRRFK